MSDGWTRRDVVIDQLVDDLDHTFPQDWSPDLTVLDVVRRWLLATKAEGARHG